MQSTLVQREEAITPHDTTPLPSGVTQGIYCGGAGDITFIDESGLTKARTGLLAGVEYNIHAKIVTTATTATNLKALYTQ